jgi:hypothetical protein
MDRASNGANVYFLSNLGDTTRGLHVNQFVCSNANCTSGTRNQWTDGPATQYYLNFRKLITAASNTLTDDFVFERIDFSSGFTEVGHRIGPTGAETVSLLTESVLHLDGGLDGTTPVLGFLASLDILAGQNIDTNTEAFSARVQP